MANTCPFVTYAGKTGRESDRPCVRGRHPEWWRVQRLLLRGSRGQGVGNGAGGGAGSSGARGNLEQFYKYILSCINVVASPSIALHFVRLR
jgi:hypothetical protein